MRPADQLTFSRVLLGPLAFLALWIGGRGGMGLAPQTLWMAALGITLVGDLTDLFDGIIARRHGGTELGKIADPFTDALFRLCVFLGLVTVGQFPVAAFLLHLLRDLSNMFLRQAAALRGVALGSRWSGKIKAWVQGIGAYLLIADLIWPWMPRWLWFVAVWFIALYTLASGIDYLWANRRLLREESSP